MASVSSHVSASQSSVTIIFCRLDSPSITQLLRSALFVNVDIDASSIGKLDRLIGVCAITTIVLTKILVLLGAGIITTKSTTKTHAIEHCGLTGAFGVFSLNMIHCANGLTKFFDLCHAIGVFVDGTDVVFRSAHDLVLCNSSKSATNSICVVQPTLSPNCMLGLIECPSSFRGSGIAVIIDSALNTIFIRIRGQFRLFHELALLSWWNHYNISREEVNRIIHDVADSHSYNDLRLVPEDPFRDHH